MGYESQVFVRGFDGETLDLTLLCRFVAHLSAQSYSLRIGHKDLRTSSKLELSVL
jgi:hypothetical protein